MLIRNVDHRGSLVDVQISNGIIQDIGSGLVDNGQAEFEGGGGALLPGLHDHHIHINATAAAMASVKCGPQDVTSAQALIETLHNARHYSWYWLSSQRRGRD